MDFLICYEHIVREIENDTLLKYELEKRGYSCKIIHYNDIDSYLYSTKEKAKVVITPWLRYDSNVYHYLQFAKRPYKLVNLQWEQVYSEFGIKSGLTKTDGQALRACHLCWGENSRNRLIDQGVAEEKAITLGAMQMDYGRPIFENYYLSRDSIAQEYGLDNGKKWNLFISSFAYANRDDGVKIMEKTFGSLAPLVDIHKRSQKLTLDWIEELLQTSDCEFIYRPHPSEKLDLRQKAMAERYPNFHIISDCSVKQWAKVCDKVNLWISTSNAELLSMNVDYAIIRPMDIPYDYEVESMRNEEFITAREEFLRYNNTYGVSSAGEITEKLARIAHYYSYDPEYPAYKRIADYLETVLKSEEGQKFRFSFKQHVQYGIRELKFYLISKFAQKYGNSDSAETRKNIFLKPKIRGNIIKTLQKKQSKEMLESRMLSYLKTQDIA